jgi:hypothetical protein
MILERVAYLSQSLAWSLLGALVGFSVGLHICWECRKRGVEVPFTHRAGRVGYAVLVVVVAVLAIVSQVQAFQFSRDNKATTDCLRAYSTGFADAIDASRKAAAEVSSAQDDLWRTISEGLKAPGADIRGRFERQLDDYLKARDVAKQTATANAIKAPRDICPG